METVFNLTTTAKTPFVVKNQINDWVLASYSEKDWCLLFGNEKNIFFRSGKREFSTNPQWERTCTTVSMGLEEFFKTSQEDQPNTLYFDYKPMNDIFFENATVIDSIKWGELGVPADFCKDSTIWIGNNGAHTPCHFDTYGENLVAQLYGRKRWFLVPPIETNVMKATRVPYEESSVYSRINFFTPTYQLLDLSAVYSVVLDPGDVLFVPRHWWHYVENLGVAISVNTWMPSDGDNESRLEEALVQRYVWSVCQDLTLEETQQILNPNEDSILSSPPQNEILEQVISQCLKPKKRNDSAGTERTHKKAKSHDYRVLEPMPAEGIKEYIAEKARTYNYNPEIEDSQNVDFKNRLTVSEALINSMCHPETVKIAKEKLLDQLGRRT